MFYMYLFSFDKEEKYIYIYLQSLLKLIFWLFVSNLHLCLSCQITERFHGLCFDFRVLIFRALDLWLS
jgi:hypothetical protein